MKLTKRKGFNFFRSYWDVYNELNDEDRLAFIDALLNKQFLGVEPKGLTGMAKFAWISQTNSIDSQVKGFETKTGIKLTPTDGATQPPTDGVELTPIRQVEGKGKGKVEGKVEDSDETKISRLFDLFKKEVGEGGHDSAIESFYRRHKLKKGSLTELFYGFKDQLIIDGKVHKNTLEVRKHFGNWLNTQERVGKLSKHQTIKSAGSL